MSKAQKYIRTTKGRRQAHEIVTSLMKLGEIPEVQREIQALLPKVRREWTRAIEEAMQELSDQLDVAERVRPRARDREALQDLAVSVLASLYLVASQASPPTSVIAASGRRLLLQGARFAGLSLDLSDQRAFRLLTLGNRELDYWLGRRLPRLEAKLVPVLEDFFEQFAPDMPTAAPPAAPSPAAPPAAPRPAAPEAPGEASAPGPPQVLEEVEAIVSDPQGQQAELILDSWAYRQFVTGAVVAAVIADVEQLQYVNNHPFGPDGRTTPFCRAIHGQTVAVADVYQSITRYHEAIDRGDEEAALAAVPFLTREEQQGALIEVARERGVLTPPFHIRCRTVLISVTPSR